MKLQVKLQAGTGLPRELVYGTQCANSPFCWNELQGLHLHPAYPVLLSVYKIINSVLKCL